MLLNHWKDNVWATGTWLALAWGAAVVIPPPPPSLPPRTSSVILLMKDAYTGVIFDANDPAQAAAHPNGVATSSGRSTAPVNWDANKGISSLSVSITRKTFQ